MDGWTIVPSLFLRTPLVTSLRCSTSEVHGAITTSSDEDFRSVLGTVDSIGSSKATDSSMPRNNVKTILDIIVSFRTVDGTDREEKELGFLLHMRDIKTQQCLALQ